MAPGGPGGDGGRDEPGEITTLTTSPDGQWCAVRRGREVLLFGADPDAPAVGRLTLTGDDVDLLMVGPPALLVSVTRTAEGTTLLLHLPPYLDAVARHDLDAPMRALAITGQRIAMVTADGKRVVVIRAAGRALTAHPLDVGSPIEFVVGLERNQLLFGLLRKLEAWDAVSGRPLVRLGLQLPPPPRELGAAAGHLWATRPGSDEIFIYRLSDGRPFRHYVGANVERVICNPASPLLVLVTPRGLVRLNCFAHSLTVIEPPPAAGYAITAVGEDATLLGLGPDDGALWRFALGGSSAKSPSAEPATDGDGSPTMNAADRLRAMRDASGAASEAAGGEARDGHDPRDDGRREPRADHRSGPAPRPSWREALTTFALELARGVEGELPTVPVDTELGDLAHRLGLAAAARRGLTALYGLYLIGEPPLPIHRLAKAIGGEIGWSEALGRGELAACGLVTRLDGKVTLHRAACEHLDGAPPPGRLVGGAVATTAAPGLYRIAAAGRSVAALEADLATALGRIAVLPRLSASAILGAALGGAAALTFTPPHQPPAALPRRATALIVVDEPRGWLAELPTL